LAEGGAGGGKDKRFSFRTVFGFGAVAAVCPLGDPPGARREVVGLAGAARPNILDGFEEILSGG